MSWESHRFLEATSPVIAKPVLSTDWTPSTTPRESATRQQYTGEDMSRNVICISRTLGAAGEELGKVVADKLSFRYVDEEIVVRAAEVAGVSPQTIAESERFDGGETYSESIEQVIRQTAEQGDVVIVAHGASIPLAGRPRVLRVFVTASPESRARRLADVDAIDAAAAHKAIDESDNARARYLERFYDVEKERPTDYDVTVNTDTMTIANAARLVVQAALTL
jgi:cytidylate kinase